MGKFLPTSARKCPLDSGCGNQENAMSWEFKADYEYTKAHKERQWAWEFLRRSPLYRADFLLAQQTDRFFFPKKHPTETIAKWRTRVVGMGLEPHSEEASASLARKWRMLSGPPNPLSKSAPTFEAGLVHKISHWEEISTYFAEPDGGGPFLLKEPYLVMVVRRDMPLRRVRPALDKLLRKEVIQRSTRNVQLGWCDFLRILDAVEAGATAGQIREKLPKSYGDDACGSAKLAASKLSKHKGLALELREDPLSILGLSPRQIVLEI
jgi:hypothetical protein